MSGYSEEELEGLWDFYLTSLFDYTLGFLMPEFIDQELGRYLSIRDLV